MWKKFRSQFADDASFTFDDAAIFFWLWMIMDNFVTTGRWWMLLILLVIGWSASKTLFQSKRFEVL